MFARQEEREREAAEDQQAHAVGAAIVGPVKSPQDQDADHEQREAGPGRGEAEQQRQTGEEPRQIEPALVPPRAEMFEALLEEGERQQDFGQADGAGEAHAAARSAQPKAGET